MKSNKNGKLAGCMLVAMVLSCTSSFGAVLEKPTANLTEPYDSAAGWQSGVYGITTNKASAGWTDSAMVAKFIGWPVGSLVPSQNAQLVAVTNSSDGRFSGDFSKIDAVSFDVQIQNSAPLIFFFKSTTGVCWKRRITELPSNTATGEVVRVIVPLAWSQEWWSFVAEQGSPDFAVDKASVSQFGFEVERNDSATYSSDSMLLVDNVRLIGPWDNQSNWVSESVPLAWLLDNNLGEADVYGNADGDAFSNAAEFLAGTDPNDSNSFFRVEIGYNDQGRTVLKWKDNKYVQFDVLETSDLRAGFAPRPGAVGIKGVGTEKREMPVDEAGVGARFFKIEIRPAE